MTDRASHALLVTFFTNKLPKSSDLAVLQDAVYLFAGRTHRLELALLASEVRYAVDDAYFKQSVQSRLLADIALIHLVSSRHCVLAYD